MLPSTVIRPPSLWTRILDDTGGGNSLTQFQTLYFEGSTEEAFAALWHLFGVKSDASTPEYGPCLSASSHPSFEAASWFERGADWDRTGSSPIERARLATQPLISSSEWMARCETVIERALAHSQDLNASRHGKMLALDRASTLAAIHGWAEDESSAGGAERAEETIELALAEAGGPNRKLLLLAAAASWHLTARNNHPSLAPIYAVDRVDWNRLFERFEGSDYEALRAGLSDAAALADLDCGLTLTLSVPARGAAPHFERLATTLSEASLDRLVSVEIPRAMSPKSESFFATPSHGTELISRVEAIALSRLALPGARACAAPRL